MLPIIGAAMRFMTSATYYKLLILDRNQPYINNVNYNCTAKTYDVELYLKNLFNMNWLQACIFLDPIVLKFRTKKLLTYRQNLKGG
jgi:hypothetical protein